MSSSGRELHNTATRRTHQLVTQQHLSFIDATRQAAREVAQQNGLAYYEGTNGVFTRVYP
jgi:hypothetical protein